MGKAILISIHPKHMKNILAGNKVFEYRKIFPKQSVSQLVFYCTTPLKKVVAVAEVLGCFVGTPTRVWNETFMGSGISRRLYRSYYLGQNSAKAFLLGKVYEIRSPFELSCLTTKTPPQSYCYLSDSDMGIINERKSPLPINTPSLVFVGGIHGVGKSSTCRKAFGPLGYKCLTASSLIAAQGWEPDRNKRVENVGDNQSILIERIAMVKEKYCRLVIDGHFTLINGDGNIVQIPASVFEEMKPSQFILIKDDPVEIAARLKRRDNHNWDISFLEKYQNQEEGHARELANKLGVVLNVVNKSQDLIKLIKDFKRKSLYGIPDLFSETLSSC